MANANFVRLLAGCALSVCATACSADPQQAAQKARKAFAAHQYLAAQKELALALTALPDDAGLLELRARLALATGDGIAADANLARLPLRNRPADYLLLSANAALQRDDATTALKLIGTMQTAPAQRLRSLALLANGDQSGADAAFLAGLAIDPHDASLFAARARLKLGAGDTPGARKLVNQALLANASSLDSMLINGEVSTAEGDLKRAFVSYDQAAKAYPGNVPALIGKATILGDTGKFDELETLVASMKGQTGEAAFSLLEARTAAARGKWSRVREILQAQESSLGDRDDASLLYAQALIELGQPEQARKRLGPMLLKHPESLLLRRALAKAQMATQDSAGAVTTLRPLARSQQASADDLRMLASAAKAAGDPDLATYEARARFPSPRALGAALAQGDSAMKAGNWGNAIKAYEQILAVTDGRSALVLNNMAWAQSNVGNKQKALEFAERAITQAPGDASVMDTLGWLLIETGGSRKRALELLQAAAAKAPQNQTINKHLAKALRA